MKQTILSLIEIIFLAAFIRSADASQSFTEIATTCATKYNVNVARTTENNLEEISGKASLDLVEFLELFPKPDRASVARMWIECLSPKFRTNESGEILPNAIVSENRVTYPDLTGKKLEIDTQVDINGMKSQDFPFQVKNNCDIDLAWREKSGLGFTWSFVLNTEFDSEMIKSLMGTNFPPLQLAVGPGKYYLRVKAKRGAVRARLLMTTRCAN
ncbi:MAG: hypothetical protein AB7E72_01540 [Lysobacterales bacterium]